MPLVTYEGNEFDLLNPQPHMINLKDVFRSLPRLNRFVGHSSRRYSVGEHTYLCLVMAQLLGFTKREQLLVFIHDFTEAYCGDCPAPLKRLLPDFAIIEAKIEDVIYKHIGIEPPTEEEYRKIKGVDLTMLVIEMRDLTVHSWENFIGELTYTEILDDDLLKISDKEPPKESMIRSLLETLYNNLIKELKEENHD